MTFRNHCFVVIKRRVHTTQLPVNQERFFELNSRVCIKADNFNLITLNIGIKKLAETELKQLKYTKIVFYKKNIFVFDDNLTLLVDSYW